MFQHGRKIQKVLFRRRYASHLRAFARVKSVKHHPPPADTGADESARRIREGLGAELDQRGAAAREVKAGLGLSQDYLRKVVRGTRPISIERLLETLRLMGIDAGRFFANVLGTRVRQDALLEELEGLGEIHPRLQRIERALAKLEVAEPPATTPPPIDAEAMLAHVLACTGKEQRRRLRHTEKYRHPAFAAAYLEHLDALRYDDPKEARQNAEVVVVWLIPAMPESNSERLTLELEAIGIYASALRQKGKFAMAARALRRALAAARAHGLHETTAQLLVRAACLLSDHGRFSDVMDLLDEALVIYYDLQSQIGLGAVMVERGTAFYNLGEYPSALGVLERSLSLLRADSVRAKRNRLVAYQVIALAHEKMEDLERAEAALARAVLESDQAGRLNRASLLWDHGVIALARGAHERAEESLREAAAIFRQLKDPNQALVALDLTKALTAQGRTLEAVAMATGMAEYLTTFRGNEIAEAAISEFIRTALAGKLTTRSIDRVQRVLLTAHDGPVHRSSSSQAGSSQG